MLQRRRIAAHIHENPALPLLDAHGHQCVLGGINGGITEPCGRLQGAIELVDPGVVGAANGARIRGAAGLQQLMAAMAADIEKAVQRSRIIAGEQNSLPAQTPRAVIAGARQLFLAAQADPRRFEKMFLLPGKDFCGGIGFARQCAAGAKGRHHALERVRRNRCRDGSVPCCHAIILTA